MLAFFATVITLLAAAAILLCNAAMTSFFLQRPPQGERAMGLVIPFFGLPAACLLMLFAALLVCFRSNSLIGHIHATPMLASLVALAVTFGVLLAAMAAFMLWVEPNMLDQRVRVIIPITGWLAGITGPVLLAICIIMAANLTRSADASPSYMLPLRIMWFSLIALALAGYAMAGLAASYALAHQRARHAAVLKDHTEREAKYDAHRRKPLIDRIRDELTEFSPDAPLWTIIAYLADPDNTSKLNDESRQLIIARALKVPDFDNELLRCMESKYSLYRQGASELLIHVPEDVLATNENAWSAALVKGINTAADRMELRPSWLHETFDLNPDPLAHVKSLLEAANRFKGRESHQQLSAEIERLTLATSNFPNDPKTRDLDRLLSKHGYQAPPR